MALRADRLKALRAALSLTQDELAERAGIQKRALQRYESGDEPPLGVASKLAQALATTTDYLSGMSDDPAPKLTLDDLSPEELALIIALRNRQSGQAIQAFAALSKADQ